MKPRPNRTLRIRAAAGAPPRARTVGFTLLEVVAAMAILAILAALAVPSFTTQTRAGKTNAAISDLRGDLLYARGEAFKRNQAVLVCPAGNLGTNCGNGTNWAGGWVVCVDANGDGACDAATTTTPSPLRVRAALDSQLQLTGPATPLRFNGGGELTAATTFLLSGTWSGSTSTDLHVQASGAVHF